ncbi:DUF927 domain-containing protein [Ancylobacter vacuolatus]|uniref:DUF927 domain-containing protein n=1 Tax=Ancylobacter vacuolatus TaxID=223389 RepID=A0ABU0DMZ6_9HYPH|nr:DUF927 domain-containing protein [Ancylobacter vacuolatus]MDQ0349818.1 hypothetical protein [Ancylobacter vacuolatus]
MTKKSEKKAPGTSPATSNNDAPRVLEAIEGDGRRHVRYGTSKSSMWVEKGALALNAREVFAQFENLGITHGPADFAKAKGAISEYADFAPSGSAATRPGWLGDVYFFRDGTRTSADDSRPILFEPDQRYVPRGSLEGWQAAIGCVAKKQEFILTAMAAAFVGPLHPYLPPGSQTVLLELVGPPHCGKSTVALLAASVWAGDAGNPLGGADSWQMTANAVDARKRRGADGLLVWDEVNTAGASEQQRELIRSAYFGLTSAGAKERFGDKPVTDALRAVLISTSNRSVAERFSRDADDDRAVRSRVLTLLVPEAKYGGVFPRKPRDFGNREEAIQFLRREIDAHYGCAGRAFVQRLVAADPARLRRRVSKWWSRMLAKAEAAGIVDPRHRQILAAIYAAGKVATDMGIMGKDWGFSAAWPLRAVGRSPEPSRPKALSRLERYIRKYEAEFLDVEAAPADLTRDRFKSLRGLTRTTANGAELLVPVPAFEKAFQNPGQLARDLRDRGIIKGGTGTKPKISIHAPRRFRNGVRVYRILLDRLQSA